MLELYDSDAYKPTDIAEKVETVGVAKASLPWPSTFALGTLAGGFIGFGAMFYTLIASDPTLGFAASKVLGGAVFSVGLILVVVAGTELFTGNTLMVMAAVSRKIRLNSIWKNLALRELTKPLGRRVYYRELREKMLRRSLNWPFSWRSTRRLRQCDHH